MLPEKFQTRERAGRRVVRLNIKVTNADLPATASDAQARMHTARAHRLATKESRNLSQAQQRNNASAEPPGEASG